MTSKIFGKRVFFAVIAAAAIFVATVLSGCTLFDLDGYYAEFTKSVLNISLGDEYDLKNVISSNIGRYEVSSSAPDVAYVSDTTLTAKSEGRAVLTLSSPETPDDKMTVVVAQSGLIIEYDGELVQTVGNTREVTFGVNATGSVADGRIYWFVDGTRTAIRYADETFSFTPSGAGDTVITAKCANDFDINDSVTVRAYYAVEASGTVEGELVCDEGSPLVLSVQIESNADNLDDYIEWRVDGKPLYSGKDKTYEYSAQAGRHKIELYVNGVKRTVNGSDYVTVLCSGSVVPKNVEVVFDNMYPHVYVRAEVEGDMQVKIIDPDGRANVYNKNITPDLFDENGFDAASVMDLCGRVRSVYKISVKSLGDGELLEESEYGEYYEFYQLPYSAKAYIENIYHDRDHYITSNEEYVALFEYYVISRSKTTRSPRIKFDCYVGYKLEYSADEMWNYAFRIGATSGNYTGRGAWLSDGGTILHTDMTVNTVNNPNRQTYNAGSNKYSYNVQLHSNLPHINYDEQKYRDADYVFAIDKRSRTASVTYGDELYLAAQNGVKPLPVAGSSAETVYGMARDILRKIVSDDMTDKQKAHAIYDWIMWQVTYDTPATEVYTNGEAYSAYYLEGVFGNYYTEIDGVVYAPFAVCDGMSKAYALMCNIEGIPCVRVAGMAGSGATNAGGHAWNKVQIDGKWYIVDCTWGDSVSHKRVFGVYADYEFGLHDWLFVTDDMAKSTHYEPYMYKKINPEWGVSEIVYAPKTADEPLSPYVDMEYNGKVINCEIAAGENQKSRVEQIVSAFADSLEKNKIVRIPGTGIAEYYNVKYQSIEFRFEERCTMSDSLLSSTIKSIVAQHCPTAQTEVFKYDKIVLVIIKP